MGRRKKRRRRKKERDTQKEGSSLGKEENPIEASTDEDDLDAAAEAENAASSIIKLKSIANRNGLFLEAASSAASQPNSEHSEVESEAASETEDEKKSESEMNKELQSEEEMNSEIQQIVDSEETETVKEIADILVKEILKDAFEFMVKGRVSEALKKIKDDNFVEDRDEDSGVVVDKKPDVKAEENETELVEGSKKDAHDEMKTEENLFEETSDKDEKQESDAEYASVQEASKDSDPKQDSTLKSEDDPLLQPGTIINSGGGTPLTSSTPRHGPSQLNSDDDEEGSSGRPSLVAPPSSSTQSGGGIQPSSPRGEGGDGGGDMLRAQVQNNVNTLIERMSTSIQNLVVHEERGEDGAEDAVEEAAAAAERRDVKEDTGLPLENSEVEEKASGEEQKREETECNEMEKPKTSDANAVQDKEELNEKTVEAVDKLVQDVVNDVVESAIRETVRRKSGTSVSMDTQELQADNNQTKREPTTKVEDANSDNVESEANNRNESEPTGDETEFWKVTEQEAVNNEAESPTRAAVNEKEYWQQDYVSASSSSTSELNTPPVMQLDDVVSRLEPKGQRQRASRQSWAETGENEVRILRLP